MGSNDQYGVDLDELDLVIQKLNQVVKDMGGPKSDSENSTYLPQGVLGNNFSEQQEFNDAHAEMKKFIQDKIIKKIEDLVDDFGQKATKTKGAYEDAEADNTVNMA